MTELASIRRRLFRALDLTSLLLLGALPSACTSTEKDPLAVEPPPLDPYRLEPYREPHPEPHVEPSPAPRPCPPRPWCGSQALVEQLGRADLDPLFADVEGCPGAIEGRDHVDQKPREDCGRLEELQGDACVRQYDPEWNGLLAIVDVEATRVRRAAGEADLCCYQWATDCERGRPLIIDGRPWIAGLRAGRSWPARLLPEARPALALPDHLRERIVQDWLRDALAEHASIASFARARAELQAIDAPQALLRACERAAEDEVEHARMCFALAERFGGRSFEPTALPKVSPRSSDPIAVARDTFVEGCVGETIAAGCARRAASLATDPVVRAVLERIADDETEHAALAWRTIAWLARREGPQVVAAIERLADERRPSAPTFPTIDPDARGLLAYGRLDRRTMAATERHAWRDLIDPLLAELSLSPTGARALRARGRGPADARGTVSGVGHAPHGSRAPHRPDADGQPSLG